MKKIYNIICLTAVTLLMLQGCKSEKIEYIPVDGTSGDAVGYLSIASFDLQVADYAEEITSSGNDPELTRKQVSAATRARGEFNSTKEADGDYVIRVRNISTGEEQEFSYDGLKQIENGQIPLTPGTYVVSAESPDYESYMSDGNAAGWDSPVYYGETSATIVSKKETEVTGIVCRLANIKATVSLTPDLANLFLSDSECELQEKAKLSVTLSAGDNSLQYVRSDMETVRAGYFKVDKGASQTIDVLLKGQYNTAPADAEPEYVEVNWKSSLPGCKAGQWRKISIGLTNAAEGNVRFEITVESWTYGETVDVDVTKMYSFAEEIIDDGASDENSPVLSLDGGDIADGYTLHAGMYDNMLNKWTDNLRLHLKPAEGSKVETVTVEVTGSDNEEFLAAVDALGVRKRTIEVYPDASALSGNLAVSDNDGGLTFALNDSGMSKLFQYKGEHHLKVTAVDDRYRFSYTEFTITCLEGEVVIGGPEIVWTNSDGTVTYDFDQVYTIDESLQVKINVSTESTFTGFNVVIEGDILSDEILGIVGLTRNLDLINPGDAESMLRDLGFPTGTDVTSKTEIGFDISGFLTMIEGVAGAGITECGFRLIVTDAHGTTEKTVQLRVQK